MAACKAFIGETLKIATGRDIPPTSRKSFIYCLKWCTFTVLNDITRHSSKEERLKTDRFSATNLGDNDMDEAFFESDF